jgi:hypothetical protein
VRSNGKKRFCLLLVKPSHYDDDGHVIQWLRSPIPSTSLAALYGLARDCAERRVLGPDVEIDVHAFDETNTRIRCDRLAAMIRVAGAGMVMLVGVQSNQFPRALDLAKALRERDIPVAIGGFHVSGTLSMLDGADPDLERATAMGVSLFAGEAEGRLERVLRDADAGALAPLYNFMDDLPGIEGTPIPLLAAETVRRTAGGATSFDAGRGCPYQCSFCTIINVQGRKSRHRSPTDIEKIVCLNYAEGMRSFFITDDNFARNKDWEPILDRLIHLREVESSISASSSRWIRSATSFPISSRNARARACDGCSSDWKTSILTISSARRNARTRSPNTARCCSPGKPPASSPMPATS